MAGRPGVGKCTCLPGRPAYSLPVRNVAYALSVYALSVYALGMITHRSR